MNNPAPRAEISEGRQLLYYIGMALTAIGLLLFFSVFFSAFSRSSSEPSFDTRIMVETPDGHSFPMPGQGPAPRQPRSFQDRSNDMAKRAFGGMALMLVGGILINLGRAGLRGSGVILDPHGARDDLKPWSQAAGGMLDDALGSSHVVGQVLERSDDKPREVVRVRCPNCRTLNDEDAKFCDNCGATL